MKRTGIAGFLGLAFAFALLPLNVVAQPVFSGAAVSGAFQDAVVHEGALYVAVLEDNAVWVLDPATGAQQARIAVGAGPVALALDATGRTLACVNRDSNTLSLIDLDTATLLADVPVGAAPSGVTAMRDGRFAVADGAGGSVTLVEAGHGGLPARTERIANVLPAPGSVAESGRFLGVLDSMGPEVAFIDLQRGESGAAFSISRIPLEAAPGAIAGIEDGRFAVATRNAVHVVDATSGQVIASRRLRVVDMAADRGGLLVLAGDNTTIFCMDGHLATTDTWRLAEPATSIVVSGNAYVAAKPQDGSWQVHVAAHGAASGPRAALRADASDSAPDGGAPLPEELGEAELDEEHEWPAQPEPLPQAIEPDLREEPGAIAAPPVTQLVPSRGVQRHPLRTETVRAPRSDRRPDAVPLRQLDRRTITDALAQPTEFGSIEAGFQPPDWTAPLQDIEAQRGGVMADGTRELEGQVQLRWGDMNFSSDHFSYSPDLGEVRAEGNVLITQRESRLSANLLHYVLPAADETEEEPQVFAPVLSPEDVERRRLTLGRIYARELAVYEPTRSLVAEEVRYDFADSTGEMLHVHGQADIYYFGADRLRILGPASLDGDDVWVTTCDLDPPHYRIRLSQAELRDGVLTAGSNARLQLGEFDTPFYLPRWRRHGVGVHPWTFDFDSGRRAEVGAYLNVGQRFDVTPDLAMGPRIYATQKEGVGFGADMDYDFRENPASRLYRTSGQAEGLYTTKSRGYAHWYHRYDYSDDLVLRMQVENWSDRSFYKDFYYDRFRNRTTPRSFANVTYRQDRYIATGTAQVNTHSWTPETERLPEATFHWLEQPLLERLYLSYDSFTGYHRQESRDVSAFRTVNVARLTYDWDPLPALSITPFVELEGSWYSRQRLGEGSASRVSSLFGATAQTRFQKVYPGRWGFSAFKHVVVPSVTYSYQPASSMNVLQTPRFDDLDRVFGRSRIESKLANVVFGRDEETNEVWQVARLSLFQGNDLWNEVVKSSNYEIELDLRPVRWMGAQLVAERHKVSRELEFGSDSLRLGAAQLYEQLLRRPYFDDNIHAFEDVVGDYDRMLAQVYYAEAPLTGRLGFAYTRTRDAVFNREVIYGLGYELNEHWGVGFEHRYDFADSRLRSQSYEIRRSLHCWETTLRVRDRESGFDVDLTFNIRAFPGSRLKL